MNKFIGIGRLTKEPELKTVGKDKTLANFTIAINRAYQKDVADFLNCTVWGKTAEYISKYAKKGQLVAVEGELNIDKVNDKYFTKISASNVNILSSKGDGVQDSTPLQAQEIVNTKPTANLDSFDTDTSFDFDKKTNEFDDIDVELPF